jgi:hypothetical protein
MARVPRISVPPPVSVMSQQEREIVEWMGYGAGLWRASQLANVSLCQALDWYELGQLYSQSAHGRFSAEVRRLEATNNPSRSLSDQCVRLHRLNGSNGQHSNGQTNGSNGSNGHKLLRVEDL